MAGIIDTWRGVWDTTAQYGRGDAVVHPNGSTYLAIGDPPIGASPLAGDPWVYVAWHNPRFVDDWRGLWQPGTQYAYGDLVVRPTGSTYLAVQAPPVGQEPEKGDPWVPLDARPVGLPGRTPEFLTGNGAPGASLGLDHDSYLDVDSGRLWVKAAGAWQLTDGRLAVGPSAWLPLPLDTATVKAYSAELTPAYRMNCGRLEMRGVIAPATGATFGGITSMSVPATVALEESLRPEGAGMFMRGAVGTQTKNAAGHLLAKWEMTRNAGILSVVFPPYPAADSGPAWADLSGVSWALADPVMSVTVPVKSGVTYRSFSAGHSSPDDGWRATVAFPNGSELTQNKVYAQATVDEVVGRGYQAVLLQVDVPASSDLPERRGAAYGCRVGQTDLVAAQDTQRRLRADGYTSRLVYSTEFGICSGPWRTDVVYVAPGAVDRLRLLYGRDVSTAQTCAEMTVLGGCVAGMNANEFDVHTSSGFPGYEGVPNGIFQVDGKLLHAATNGVSALVFGGGTAPYITEVTTTLNLTVGGTSRTLNGMNRVPGRILGCGVPGALINGVPWETPARAQQCTNPAEIIQFTPEWGAVTATPNDADYFEAVIGTAGSVIEIRDNPSGSGTIPSDGYVLAGAQAGADWLRTHAAVGAAVSVTRTVTDASGAALPSGVSIASAGHCRIVKDAAVFINSGACGIVLAGSGLPAYTPAGREPRNAVGITADGTVLFIAMNGRDASEAVGVTYQEAAETVLRLGCVDALLFGGGGDVNLAANGAQANNARDNWFTKTNRPMAVAIGVLSL